MNLTIDEVKVMRMGLKKVPLSRAVCDLTDKIDAYLAEQGWRLEHRALPKVKYQRNHRYEYVWVEINNQ